AEDGIRDGHVTGVQTCALPIFGGGHNLFNGSIITTPDLQTVCGGVNTGHPQIHNIVDVRNTIMQGRTGTDMPSWSVRFAGGLDRSEERRVGKECRSRWAAEE